LNITAKRPSSCAPSSIPNGNPLKPIGSPAPWTGSPRRTNRAELRRLLRRSFYALRPRAAPGPPSLWNGQTCTGGVVRRPLAHPVSSVAGFAQLLRGHGALISRFTASTILGGSTSFPSPVVRTTWPPRSKNNKIKCIIIRDAQGRLPPRLPPTDPAKCLGIDLSSLRTVEDIRQMLSAAVARGEIAPAEGVRIARRVPARLRAADLAYLLPEVALTGRGLIPIPAGGP
jgi:hypothetical protein